MLPIIVLYLGPLNGKRHLFYTSIYCCNGDKHIVKSSLAFLSEFVNIKTFQVNSFLLKYASAKVISFASTDPKQQKMLPTSTGSVQIFCQCSRVTVLLW